jgi:MoxR-like ATPase
LSETEAMTTLAPNETQLVDRIEEVGAKIQKVRETTASVIFGQDRVIDLALITVLSGGHALLIGVPGLAKTSLVETLGTVLGLENKRIQFTPDLMPSDIVGSEVLEEGTAGRRSFRFVKGPIFTQLLMADEINRASPKTQSALLQAMQEHHVTMAGVRHDVPRPFHVLATQNPFPKPSSTASYCRSTCPIPISPPSGACCLPRPASRTAC